MFSIVVLYEMKTKLTIRTHSCKGPAHCLYEPGLAESQLHIISTVNKLAGDNSSRCFDISYATFSSANGIGIG